MKALSLADVAEAYLQDQGVAINGQDVLPEQVDFVKITSDFNRSLMASREMYSKTPFLIAQKQAQLRESVAKAQRRVPVHESLADHFAFEDYQDYLRSIGSLDDEPNFNVVRESNLAPILSVLYDETVSASRGWRKAGRMINGFMVTEEIEDSTGGTRGGFDDLDAVYTISRRPKATQTEVNVNDKSLLGEITRMASEVGELQEVLRSQERRLTMWEVFRDTVVKRLTGVMIEARSMQAVKEAELAKLIELLTTAMKQNEELVNKLSAVTYIPGADGTEGGLTMMDVENEKRRVAGAFAAAMSRAKKQRYFMEQRCEALEHQALLANEEWTKRLASAQRDLVTLHRGFLEGAVSDSINRCEENIERIVHDGLGGDELHMMLDNVNVELPSELAKQFRLPISDAFESMDKAAITSMRVAVDLVKNGHRTHTLAEGLRNCGDIVPNIRRHLSNAVATLVKLFKDALIRSEVRLIDQKRNLKLEFEAEMGDVRKELETEQKAAAMQRKLAALRPAPTRSFDFGSQVYESVIDSAMGRKKGSDAASEGPPRYKAKSKTEMARPLDGFSAAALYETATGFLGEMVEETKNLRFILQRRRAHTRG